MPLEIFGEFGFAAGFDQTANPLQDPQVCINWYPEIAVSKEAKEVVGLLGAPGLNQVAAAPGGGAPGFNNTMTAWPAASTITNLPVRGMWVLPGMTTALVVIGNVCYLAKITTYGSQTTAGALSLTKVGTLATNKGPVSIRDNNAGGHAVLVDGTFGYFYNISTLAFTQIIDDAFLGASSVAFIDGWWIFNKPNSQVFFTNTPQYSTTFSGSYFALKDSSSDNLIGVIENKEELWLIGERTTEIWYDAGGQYFPFQRLVGSPLQMGCKAPASISRFASNGQEGLIWLGRADRGENIIIRTKGFNYEVVSTPAIANFISNLSYTADAVGYVYEEGSHEFYVLTFPTADVTLVYDGTLPPEFAWTQRASYDPYSNLFHRHRSNCYMNFGGMRIVGDYENGALYQMSREFYTDAGWPIKCRRRSPVIWNRKNRERVHMHSLQVDFTAGAGNASGIGNNPKAYLSISRDGGQTFGQSFPSYMGAIGKTQNRCMWRKIGMSRNNVIQIEVTDPVNRDIVGATLRAIGP